MSDKRLRKAQRLWRESQEPAAGRSYLEEVKRSGASPAVLLTARLEIGDLEAWRVRLAAWLQHAPSREALGWGDQDPENKEELAEALPAWFWACIDMAHPKEEALLENLSKAPLRMVGLYQFLLESAAESVCDYWQGPFVPELDLYLSEDSTEDFCKWVVCQGEAFWRSAIAPDADLSALVSLEHAADRDPSLARSDAAASTIWRLKTVDDDFRDDLQDLYEEFEEDPTFILLQTRSRGLGGLQPT